MINNKRNVLYKNKKVLFIDEMRVNNDHNNYETVELISGNGESICKVIFDFSRETFQDTRIKNRNICDIVADYFDIPHIGKLPNGFADEHVLMWVDTDEHNNPLWETTPEDAEEFYNNSDSALFLSWELLTDLKFSPQGINRDPKWRIKLL